MLLVGAAHNAEMIGNFGQVLREVPQEPSVELIATIHELNRGSRVAVEITERRLRDYREDPDDFTNPVIECDSLGFSEEELERRGLTEGYGYIQMRRKGAHFFDRVVEEAQVAGHDVVFVDSDELLDEAERHVARAGVLKTEHKRSWAERQMAEHIVVVSRELHIFRQMGLWMPDMSVIGAAHADELAINEATRSQYGITVDQYFRSWPDNAAMTRNFCNGVVAPVTQLHDANPQIDQQALFWESERVKRNYRAATQGRVTENAPQFIGTFEPWVPASGLFEVYPDHDRRTGNIEDHIGTATFTDGLFTDSDVRFTKTYQVEKSGPGASSSPIRYEGIAISLFDYEGEWESASGNVGKFTLRIYDSPS